MSVSHRTFINLLILLLYSSLSNAQTLSNVYNSYIEKYNQLAMKQQQVHGIPASIILAQGLLESSAGQSWLAVNSNNHFGIKCGEWQGNKINKDDDKKDDCFRKYNSVIESYEDHSLFIKNRSWYGSLFELSKTDYEGWAFGLKKAGYATNPTYAYKLISIIEIYKLHQYDLIQKKEDIITTNELITTTGQSLPDKKPIGTINAFAYHKILKNNKLRYVIALINDTYGSIADEFNIDEIKLREFNDVLIDVVLVPDSKIYLQTKKRVAEKKYPMHEVKEGETMYGISQAYGIQLESLYKLNKMPYTQGAKVGQILKLRK